MAAEWKSAFIIFSVCDLQWLHHADWKRCRPWSINASPRQNLSMMFFGIIIRPPNRSEISQVSCIPQASQPLCAATIMRLQN